MGEPDPFAAYEDSLDIAVVGMSARLPGARDVEEYWDLLRAGRCAVSYFDEDSLRARGVPEELLSDPNYVRAGCLLEDSEYFDADFFGYSPREAELMDPQHRVLLECSWTALEDAGYDAQRYDGSIGVFAGASNNTYLMFNIASHGRLIDSLGGNQVMLGNSADFLTTRVSYKLGLDGPSVSVQTACSTSLVAIVLACHSLQDYQCDMALAGGVTVDPLKHDGYLYTPDGLYSPDGLCRSFDARAAGTSAGNGAGVVVLKRLYDALTDGDDIRAVVRGTAINNDGDRRAGYTAPSADAQALAITTALAGADVEPESIGYVETHGTATVLGDPIEVAALTAAFGGPRSSGDGVGASRGRCAIGSVKTNIGHLDAAAGVAGFIKTVLAVQRGYLPPTLHFTEPNPRIDFDSGPFYVNTELTPWPDTPGPRRAGVSSFGLGGTNAHVVLEQAPELPRGPRAAEPRPRLLVLSARSEAALEESTARLGTWLRSRPRTDLADVAHTLATGRRQLPYRRTMVCRDVADALDAIDRPDEGRLLSGYADDSGTRPIAFLFTGYGDHYPAMAGGLYRAERVFADAFDRCAETLAPTLGRDLRDVTFAAGDNAGAGSAGTRAGQGLRAMLGRSEPDDHPLNRPGLGHPALFAVEYALTELWRSWGVEPDFMIGHSLGEYLAAHVAGVLSLEDALRLVAGRAELIERHAHGAMLAVPAGEDVARRFAGPELGLAAVNAARTCVLSGSVAGIEEAAARLRAEGIASRRLPTSAAAHSPLIEPVTGELRELMAGVPLHPPRIPFVSNVTGTWITPDEATDPGYWVRQVREPVRFADGLGTLWAKPGVVMVEAGPGQTLTSAALQHPAGRGIADRVVVPSLPDAFAEQSDDETLSRALGRLWLAGVPVDWRAVHSATPGRRVPLPTYPFQRKRFWLERDRSGGTAGGTGGAGRKAARDWYRAPSWRRLGSAAPAVTNPAAQRWLVLADGGGVGDELAARLARTGAEVEVVPAGKDWAGAGTALPGRVVHCAGLDDHGDETPAAFDGLVRWLRTAEPRLAEDEVRCDVVTAGAVAVTGDEPLRPLTAMVRGFCLVAEQEHPGLRCGHVDVMPGGNPADVADAVLAELIAPDAPPLVALRGRHRWVPDTLPAPPPESATPRVRAGGVYLITGGLGKVGRVVAHTLAEAAKAAGAGGIGLVLTGRSGLPPRETWAGTTDGEVRERIATVRDLEELGATVHVATADTADREAMRRVIADVTARLGPITGIVHAAGLTGDTAHRALTELDDELTAAHRHAKLTGARVLAELLPAESLDFAILCSSLSPLLGGLGLGAYAGANAAMDLFAELAGPPWTSVNWEGWQFAGDGLAETGMGRTVRDAALNPAEGRTTVEHVLRARPGGRIIVSTMDLERREWRRTAAEPVTAHPRPSLGTPYVAPDGELERALAGVWSDLLGVDEVGAHDNFFELGGTSLLGVQLIHRLRRELRLRVPLTAVYSGPTIRALAGVVGELREEP